MKSLTKTAIFTKSAKNASLQRTPLSLYGWFKVGCVASHKSREERAESKLSSFQEVLSSLVRHGTASGSYLIAYSLLQHENHHLVKTFFSLNRKATNQ